MQAQTHLRMLAALFPSLHRVSLWNRTPGRAGALAATIEAAWPLTVAATLDDAVADADAVIACTAAPSPFLRPDHVVPGRIIIQVGYHEATFEAIERADAVIVDLWGEFRLSSAKSLFQMHRAGRFDESRVAADLGAVVLDGWRPPQDASVFFSSFGLNVFDIALAARVLRQADGEGPGRAARD
jgi:ornithine cyclodeaminase